MTLAVTSAALGSQNSIRERQRATLHTAGTGRMGGYWCVLMGKYKLISSQRMGAERLRRPVGVLITFKYPSKHTMPECRIAWRRAEGAARSRTLLLQPLNGHWHKPCGLHCSVGSASRRMKLEGGNKWIRLAKTFLPPSPFLG